MGRIEIVIPCYNEAARLDGDAFVSYVEAATNHDVDFLFVNDGSHDETLARLEALALRVPERLRVLDLQPNRGKAEAVRAGLRDAFARGVSHAGFWDADLATPLAEIARFVEAIEERPLCQAVFGARAQLLGRDIRRNQLRHYAGRIFATFASSSLGLPVYDTQCGAKLFRRSPQIEAVFAEPFESRWIFDVEIVARMVRVFGRTGTGSARDRIYELPLDRWVDVAGSKVGPLDFIRSAFELARITRRYRAYAVGPAPAIEAHAPLASRSSEGAHARGEPERER